MTATVSPSKGHSSSGDGSSSSRPRRRRKEPAYHVFLPPPGLSLRSAKCQVHDTSVSSEKENDPLESGWQKGTVKQVKLSKHPQDSFSSRRLAAKRSVQEWPEKEISIPASLPTDSNEQAREVEDTSSSKTSEPSSSSVSSSLTPAAAAAQRLNASRRASSAPVRHPDDTSPGLPRSRTANVGFESRLDDPASWTETFMHQLARQEADLTGQVLISPDFRRADLPSPFSFGSVAIGRALRSELGEEYRSGTQAETSVAGALRSMSEERQIEESRRREEQTRRDDDDGLSIWPVPRAKSTGKDRSVGKVRFITAKEAAASTPVVNSNTTHRAAQERNGSRAIPSDPLPLQASKNADKSKRTVEAAPASILKASRRKRQREEVGPGRAHTATMASDKALNRHLGSSDTTSYQQDIYPGDSSTRKSARREGSPTKPPSRRRTVCRFRWPPTLGFAPPGGFRTVSRVTSDAQGCQQRDVDESNGSLLGSDCHTQTPLDNETVIHYSSDLPLESDAEEGCESDGGYFGNAAELSRLSRSSRFAEPGETSTQMLSRGDPPPAKSAAPARPPPRPLLPLPPKAGAVAQQKSGVQEPAEESLLSVPGEGTSYAESVVSDANSITGLESIPPPPSLDFKPNALTSVPQLFREPHAFLAAHQGGPSSNFSAPTLNVLGLVREVGPLEEVGTKVYERGRRVEGAVRMTHRSHLILMSREGAIIKVNLWGESAKVMAGMESEWCEAMESWIRSRRSTGSGREYSLSDDYSNTSPALPGLSQSSQTQAESRTFSFLRQGLPSATQSKPSRGQQQLSPPPIPPLRAGDVIALSSVTLSLQPLFDPDRSLSRLGAKRGKDKNHPGPGPLQVSLTASERTSSKVEICWRWDLRRPLCLDRAMRRPSTTTTATTPSKKALDLEQAAYDASERWRAKYRFDPVLAAFDRRCREVWACAASWDEERRLT